jgi:uncharacterized protein YlxP (DUF503 family)
VAPRRVFRSANPCRPEVVTQTMIIGILQIELIMRGNECLKDKRRIVKGLKDRLHRTFMVSVAEIGELDDHRIGLLGVALVGTDPSRVISTIDRVLDRIRQCHDVELGEVVREVLTGYAPDDLPVLELPHDP